MSVGLLALLDDIAGLVKLTATSLDDVAAQATKAGVKAAGAVIDDAAVTPKYVHGLSADRELPIVMRIAMGSLRNKLLILLPVALLLSLFLPQAIAPLLMLGGAYLCYEGAEKVFAAVFPHAAKGHEESVAPEAEPDDPAGLEEERVSGAIKTDFILSAEIMTIALAAIPTGNFVAQAVALAIAGVGITVLVYGGVALIVKADDFGVFLARNARTATARGFGRGLVTAMPHFMAVLGVVGTAAMVWVGGGIVLHGLSQFGLVWPEHFVESLAHSASTAVPSMAGFVGWLVTALGGGVFGLLLGFALIPFAGTVIGPVWRAIMGLLPKSA